MGELLVTAVIERLHHLCHISCGVIAHIDEIRREIIRREIRKLFCHVAALAAIGSAQIAHHGMAAVIVGVGQSRGFHVLYRCPVHNALLGQLTGCNLLRQQHRHRNLVHTRRIHPYIRVIIPAVPSPRVAEPDGKALIRLVQLMLLSETVRPLFQRRAINNAGVLLRRRCRGGVFGKCPCYDGGQHQQRKQQRDEMDRGFFHVVSLSSPNFDAL